MKPKLKYFLTILSFISASLLFAQGSTNTEIEQKVMAMHQAVFVTKDSVALETLLAKEITYGHSGGKLTDRKKTIEDIVHNKSTYTDLSAKEISVIINGNTAVSRYVLTGNENKEDGKVVNLHLNILMVWVKEKKHWKMMARQATKI